MINPDQVLHTILAWDLSIFFFINHDLAHPVLDAFFVTVTNGRFWILPGAVAAIVYVRAEKKRGLVVIGCMLVTVLCTDQLADAVKSMVHRLRPCNPAALIEGGRFLLGYKSSYSFPSNHAANMFGQAMLLTCFYPRQAAWFFTFASVIGFSRVYVGVHYPFDVAGGAVLGTLCGAAVWGGFNIVRVRFEGRRRANRGGGAQEPGGDRGEASAG